MSFIEEQEDIPAELRARLGMVRRNVETEARLVDDLLDMTRISRGKIHLHFEAVDLHETVRAAVAMFQPAMDGKSLEISLAQRAKQHHVWADPGRLQQILCNLLSNAVKFTGEGGRIAVRSANTQPDVIEIEVSDNGAGIEPEMLVAAVPGIRAKRPQPAIRRAWSGAVDCAVAGGNARGQADRRQWRARSRFGFPVDADHGCAGRENTFTACSGRDGQNQSANFIGGRP